MEEHEGKKQVFIILIIIFHTYQARSSCNLHPVRGNKTDYKVEDVKVTSNCCSYAVNSTVNPELQHLVDLISD